jgi:hypothetical protein
MFFIVDHTPYNLLAIASTLKLFKIEQASKPILHTVVDVQAMLVHYTAAVHWEVENKSA